MGHEAKTTDAAVRVFNESQVRSRQPVTQNSSRFSLRPKTRKHRPPIRRPADLDPANATVPLFGHNEERRRTAGVAWRWG